MSARVTIPRLESWRAALGTSARAAAEDGRRLERDSLDLLAASLAARASHRISRLAASVVPLAPAQPVSPPSLGLIYADVWSASLGWPAACFLQFHGTPWETRTFLRIQNIDQPAAVRLEGADERGRPLFAPQDLHPWPRPRIFALDFLNGGEDCGLLWQAMDLCEDWMPTDSEVTLRLTVRERGGERTLDPLVIPRLDRRTLASARVSDPEAHRFTRAFEALVAAWREREPDCFAVALEEVVERVGVVNLSKMHNLWLSAMLAELRALEPRAARAWAASAGVEHWRLLA